MKVKKDKISSCEKMFLKKNLYSLEFCVDLCIVLCCYIMVNKRINPPIVVLDELDSTIRDMAFECIVLNRYGNFEKVALYSYLHADVTNLHGFTTVIVTIGSASINFHLDKFLKRKHLRIDKKFM